jgi:hypothetical protein
MKTGASQLEPRWNAKTMAGEITKGLQSFTTKNTKNPKHQNDRDNGDGERGNAKCQLEHRGDTALDQPYVSDALAERGYHIQLRSGVLPFNQSKF